MCRLSHVASTDYTVTDSGVLLACPSGTYRPGETINANCASCPTGRRTLLVNGVPHSSHTHPLDLAGTYQNAVAQAAWYARPPLFLLPSKDISSHFAIYTSSINCNSGYFQDATRQTNCKLCNSAGTLCDAGERQTGCGAKTPGSVLESGLVVSKLDAFTCFRLLR
jgi:hypothetical protein